MSRKQMNLAQFSSSPQFAPRTAIVLTLFGIACVASCSHDWTAYDPRVDASSSSSSTGASTSSSSSSSSGAGGESVSSSSGMAGAGGMAGVGGMGGSGGAGGGGMGGAGGGPICVPDTGKACYSGPQGTENIGKCKGGATLCQADGMSYGPCLGEVTPIIEECHTPDDDDCNSVTNDHCGIWARKAGSSLDQRTLGVATDNDGNIIITGRMQGSADFGGGIITSAGGYDIFVAKYDPTGTHLWSSRIGGTTDDEGYSVATDAMGNIFVVGYFTGSLPIGQANYTSSGLQDGLLFKMDPMGQVVASLVLGGTTTQIAHDVAVDAKGAVVVSGEFATEINTGAAMFTSAGSADIFLAKYGNDLTPVWAGGYGGTSNDRGLSVTTDSTNHVYLTGTFDTKVDFGGGAITDGGGIDIFVAKFDPDGVHTLSKGFPALDNQYARAIAVDALDNIYLHGDFTLEINMGGGIVPAAGLSDVFMTKLDSTGMHVYTKTYGDAEEQLGNAMAIDKNGDLIMAIAHEGIVDYGGGPATCAGPAGSSDLLILKLKAATGAHVWSRRFGATNDQDPRCITTDGMNNIFVGGELGGTINFGPVSITSSSSDDAFIAKLNP